LLTHTSGLADHNNESEPLQELLATNNATTFTPARILEIERALPANFAPGAAWKYCDTGYYLLSLLVEKQNTNGWTFAEFIRRRLLAPQGLTNTFVPAPDNAYLREIPGRHMRGYQRDTNGALTDVTVMNQSWDQGCGGMVSTVEDLARWARALYSGQVLPAEALAEMTAVSPQARAADRGYGMATIVSPMMGVGHNGATAGYFINMSYDPVRRTAYANVVNLWDPQLTMLAAAGEDLKAAKRALGYDDVEDPRYTNTAARVGAFVAAQMEKHQVPAMSLALVDSNRIVWARGFGRADRETGRQANSETIYGICSISKTFAAAALLRLQEQGRLRLADAVTNSVPAFSLFPRFGGPPITIRQLLNHCSGMPGTYYNRSTTTAPDPGYPAAVLRWLAQDYPNFPPNVCNAYNNNAFAVAEAVVAGAAGTNYADYVQAELLAPMGMTASAFAGARSNLTGRLARSYVRGQRYPDEHVNAAGGGGLYSSASDMARWIQTLLAGGVSPSGRRVLSAESVAAMWQDETPGGTLRVMEKTFRPGLGWDCVADPALAYAGRAVWKNGGAETFGGLLELLPERGLGVIVLNNYPGDPVARPVALETLKWALKDKYGLDWPTNLYTPPPAAVTNWSAARLAAVTGCYATAGGYDLLQADGAGLTWIQNAQDQPAIAHSNLAPRVNGWFSKPDTQALELGFTNVAGRTGAVLLLRAVLGTYQDTLIRGEQTPAADPAALAGWTNRCHRLYLMADLCPESYHWLPAYNISLTLQPVAGNIFLRSGGINASALLSPVSGELAFPRGLSSAEPTALQACRINNTGHLRYSGFLYRAADTFPVFKPGTTNRFELAAGGTFWSAIPVAAGQTYTIAAIKPAQPVRLCLRDSAGAWLAAGTNELKWASATNGLAYLATVSVAPQPIVLRVELSR
jgi:CubicO group peptidase (beta-lactamase class C family)